MQKAVRRGKRKRIKALRTTEDNLAIVVPATKVSVNLG